MQTVLHSQYLHSQYCSDLSLLGYIGFPFFFIVAFHSVYTIVYLTIPTVDGHLHSFMSQFSLL